MITRALICRGGCRRGRPDSNHLVSEGLREVLKYTELPGRVLLKFPDRFISGNPGAFANADTPYIPSYFAIMLNIDLHSSKLNGRARVSPNRFVKNNHGINDSAHLPDQYLWTTYEEGSTNGIALVG